MKLPPHANFERYIGIDAHKHYVVVGGLDLSLRVVMRQRRMGIPRFRIWAQTHLKPSDAVVIEASTNTWHLYDIVAPLVGKAVVAHPPEVKQIANARVKNDKIDVYILARLLAADLIPEVWVPPVPVRELRGLISHRWRLSRTSTMNRNRLHSVIHRHNLTPPTGHIFRPKHRQWWLDQELSATEVLRVRHGLAILDLLEEQIAEVDAELARLSTVEPWSKMVPYLIQLPGFGLIVTMTVLAAIGDITRFPEPKKLVGYAGLGASVHDSGKTHRQGRITKRGRKELRWILVEAARRAVRSDAYWETEYNRLVRRKHPNEAIIAIARKLLVVVWHVLTKQAADLHADEDKVAFKMLMWAWKLNKAQRRGLTMAQFVRYHLMGLQLGNDLTELRRGGRLRPLASVEEVLALSPELLHDIQPDSPG
ncbi:MAG: IS110 family transposase [Anaerolineales bacterium]|jgi:transposase